ncbi:MAG: 4-(cytidine 5'-diphospho)-2-C-methyl-D-erythritol kinase [Alphaproteobacteria bacterium]|nr:4-(cytidine 5'-diphospho)-2-C-methyl-D-erythritol kinase [Alphaproteobacteria bacterium]
MQATAHAKINLYLHVTGQRADGYHTLDSLAVFAQVGDRLQLDKAPGFSLALEGPFAKDLGVFDREDNLVVRAVRLLARETSLPLDFRLTLTKNLPLASGIGGGSSDAAVALKLMARHHGLEETGPLLDSIAKRLGQDIPACLAAQSCYFRDVGQITAPAPALPRTPILLINPRQPLSTAAVFKARQGPFDPPAPFEADTSPLETVHDLVRRLTPCRNGLTQAASSLCPGIIDVLTETTRQKGCLLARMSGSGATCYCIFATDKEANEAAEAIKKERPWWVTASFFPK